MSFNQLRYHFPGCDIELFDIFTFCSGFDDRPFCLRFIGVVETDHRRSSSSKISVCFSEEIGQLVTHHELKEKGLLAAVELTKR